MDVMEIRRRLMMGMASPNAKKILQRLNVLYGQEYTPGYISASGGVATPGGVQKEIATEYMSNPFLANMPYIFVQEFTGDTTNAYAGGMWCGIGFYDSDGNFRTRGTFTQSAIRKIGDYVYSVSTPYILPYNDGLCRISFRTYGTSNVIIVPMFNLLTDLFNVFGAEKHTTD